ncbi:MAG: RNA-binding cell elongation regulator Jag/EloR [bacterium]
MRFVEVEGKSREDALGKAARELGVPVEDIGIEILSDGSRGFFGLMGARKVKIRAWSKQDLEEEHEEIGVRPEEGKEEDEVDEAPVALRKGPAKPCAEEAQQVLQDMLPWLSEQARVEVKEETVERVLLEIHGDRTGLLIGKRGQTLDALQYLVNKIVNRSPEGGKRIEVDMEQYRKRREQSLRNMALRLGEKAKKKKKPITIEAMNAHDRRIIHLTLKDDEALETKSVGKGEMRKLVIHPLNPSRPGRHEGSGTPA